MANVNIVILAGNLTRDVELRYSPKGTPVASFGVAVNRKWKDDAGELKEEVSFFDCVAWGRTAETIAQYFKKGGSILVQGRLKQESWDDKQDGRKRYAVKVIVESFNFVGDAAGSGERPAGRTAPTGATTGGYLSRQPAAAAAEPAAEADDVPF